MSQGKTKQSVANLFEIVLVQKSVAKDAKDGYRHRYQFPDKISILPVHPPFSCGNEFVFVDFLSGSRFQFNFIFQPRSRAPACRPDSGAGGGTNGFYRSGRHGHTDILIRAAPISNFNCYYLILSDLSPVFVYPPIKCFGMSKNNIAYFITFILIGLTVMRFHSIYSWSLTEVRAQPKATNAVVLTAEGSYRTAGSDVKYYGDTNGYFVRPETSGNYPGVVMIHEWWGLNDQIKTTADRLASYGYNVLAVDLFNGKVADTTGQAVEMISKLDQVKTIENLESSISFLKNERSTKVGVLGWCFGGGESLRVSLAEPVDATVIYYGDLITDKKNLTSLNSPVLGIFGDSDMTIPVTDVKRFRNILDELKMENEVYIYPKVGHAFANPSGPSYAPKETADAWEKTIAFLEKHLK